MRDAEFSARNAGRPRGLEDFEREFRVHDLEPIKASPHRSEWKAGRTSIQAGVALLGSAAVGLVVAALNYEAILALEAWKRIALAVFAITVGLPAVSVGLGAVLHHVKVVVDTKAREIHYHFRHGPEKHVIVRTDEIEVLALRTLTLPASGAADQPREHRVLCAEMRGGALVSLAVNAPAEFEAEVEKAFQAGRR